LARRRLEATLTRAGFELFSVLADVGNKGTLRLIPHPDQAIDRLREYLDALDDYAGAEVIVLPYVTLPRVVADELVALEDLGGTISYPTAGEGRWPGRPAGRLTQPVLDALFDALVEALDAGEPVETPAPSSYFRLVAERTPQLVIAPGALDACDEVATHRHDFMRKAADAFECILKDGLQGRIDDFFSSRGIAHAQSGGIRASVTVYRAGSPIYAANCSTHLKQGDKTARIAAVRIYYHSFSVDSIDYVVILYAGPHPSSDISRTCELPVG